MTAKKRIALIFATSGHSGVDRVVANLIPELALAHLQVDLVTIRQHGPYLDKLPANVRAVNLPASHRNTVVPSLVRYLRRERPASALTASHRLNRAVLLARALSRVPTRVAIRMGMSLSALEAEWPRRRSQRLFRSMRYWYPRAEAAIAPSQGVAEDLVRYAGMPAARVHMIPNPLVTKRLQAEAEAPLDHPWFADGAPPVILGCGSLESRKDFATLLRAFSRICRERRCRLVIVGEGRDRQRLENLASSLGVADEVSLPGYDPNPYRYMARAALFVLSSRREGSGAVLVEALATGTPVVATDCPSGPREILQDGDIGPLVPVGDDGALAAAISKSLDMHVAPARLQAAVESFCAVTAAHAYLRAMAITGVAAA